MHRKVLQLTAIPALLISILIIGCNKFDTTDIGSGLIPPVDNVTTFDTLLTVNSSQGIFNDSTLLGVADDHVIGTINDPLFGKTNASVFLELKPTGYPYFWGNAGDTIETTTPDSVFLCLAYRGFYGDSASPQKLSVYPISNTVTDFKDSGYRVGRYYPALGTKLGEATIDPLSLRNWRYFTAKKDSVQNQIRIPLRLNNAFINQLFARDSIKNNTSNNAFYSDSIFKSFYKGFAVVADTNASGIKGLFYINLNDVNTRLEFHFRKRTAGTGVKDSVYNAFRFNTTTSSTVGFSARAQYIRRDRPPGLFNDPTAIYLQTTPGTYANLTIPALSTFGNRIIHRAELVMEQVPDASNALLVPPSFLYLDVMDTPNVHWKPVPFDLNPNEPYAFYPNTGGIDFIYFGGYQRQKADPNNPTASMGYYNFNLSRYVKHIVTSPALYPNYPLRLYAPSQLLYPEFFFGPVGFSNSIAFGRVKLGSGTNPNYKLRLRIVYSRI